MNFVVTYREKDGFRNKIAIEASDRAGVFPILRERGISAIRVEEGKLPAKKGRSKWSIPNGLKLLLVGFALLSLVAVALTFVFKRTDGTKVSQTTTEEPELPPSIEKASPVCEKLQSNCPSDWMTGPDASWKVFWNDALADAKASGKKIFVLSTGSDWCGWCKKLKQDVFEKDEFKNYAQKKLVLLYLDSPRKPLPSDQKQHNDTIRGTLSFGGGVPCAAVFGVDSRRYGVISGYSKTPAEYIARIDEVLSKKGEMPKSGQPPKIFTEGYVGMSSLPTKTEMDSDSASTQTGGAISEAKLGKRGVSDRKRDSKGAPKKLVSKGLKWIDPKSGMTWCYDTFTRNGYGETLVSIKGSSVCRGALVIPKSVNGLSVKCVGSAAFSERADLISVEIPDSVEEIGWNAFADCINVKTVTLPVALEKIGESAFSGCASLADIQLPRGMTRLCGAGAFSYCTNLLSVTIPQSITALDFSAFLGCERLKTIYADKGDAERVLGLLKNTWRKFEIKGGILVAAPFEGKPVAVDTVDPERLGRFSWTDPETGAKWNYDECIQNDDANCSIRISRLWNRGFRYVTIPSKIDGKPVRSIGKEAFGGCYGMRSIVIPASIKSIGECAFVGCIRLSSILVEANNPWFKVVDGVLYDREMKTLVAIPPARKGPYVMPSSVTNDVSLALWHVEGRSDVKVSQDNLHYKSVDGVLFTKDGRCLVSCPTNRSGRYVVPEGVTSICHHAFLRCERLSAVSLPKSLLQIGDLAFHRCTNLSSDVILQGVEAIGDYAFDSCSFSKISIPGSVKKIGCGAFNACSRMSTLEICEGIKEINRDAFAQCKALESVLIPSSVTNVQPSSFWGCYALGKLETVSQNRFYSSKNGVLYDKSFKSLIICPPAKRALYIPMGVSNVADNACLANLREIFIPSSVSNIGRRAFSHSSGERTVHVCSNDAERIQHLISAAGHNTMGMRFVEDYSSADEDKVMSTFRHIDGGLYNKDGTRMFGYPCTGGVARISAVVTNISESACEDLRHAKSIEVDPQNRFYRSVGGCLYDKNMSTLVRCPNVSQMKIPEGVKCIGPHAFEYLKDLANVDVPSSVVEIGECAFNGCMGLESLSIPQGVTNIGRMAFMSCESLKSITIPSNVKMIRRHTFKGCWGIKSVVLMPGVESIGAQAFIDCPQLASMRIPSSMRMIGRNFETEREDLGAMTFGVGYTRPGPGRSMPSVCDELKIVADKVDEDRVHALLYQKTPNMERMRQIYEHRQKVIAERGGRWRTIKVVTEDECQGGKSPVKADKKK